LIRTKYFFGQMFTSASRLHNIVACGKALAGSCFVK